MLVQHAIRQMYIESHQKKEDKILQIQNALPNHANIWNTKKAMEKAVGWPQIFLQKCLWWFDFYLDHVEVVVEQGCHLALPLLLLHCHHLWLIKAWSSWQSLVSVQAQGTDHVRRRRLALSALTDDGFCLVSICDTWQHTISTICSAN